MSAPPFATRLDLASAIQQVHRDLDQVRQVKKCTSCECLLDVLAGVQSDLADVATPTAEAARADFQRW
jgi:tetrahydromethanopterin S-methyltransferase subunit A